MPDEEPRNGGIVITAQELRALRDSGVSVVILEIQRDTVSADPATVERIPGAHLVNIQTQLIGERYQGSGINPLPTRDQIQAEIERWGIDPDAVVVVYTRENASLAARGWWTLTWAGVPRVRYLDGGLAAWSTAGGILSTEAAAEGGGTFVAAIGALPSVDSEGAAELARSGLLIDVRGTDAYTGATGGGHVPGAVNRPSAGVLTDDGFLQDEAALRERYQDLDFSEHAHVGVYCGGGTSATLSALALARIGVTTTLYAGSFSEWQSDPQRPIATGEERG